MALRDDLKTWIPKLLFEVFNKPEGYIVTSADWNAMWNLNREQGDWDSNTIKDMLTMLYETVLHDTDGATAVTVSEDGITATTVGSALLELSTRFNQGDVNLNALISDVEDRLEAHRISGDHDSLYYLKSNTYTKAQVDAIAYAFVLGAIPDASISYAKLVAGIEDSFDAAKLMTKLLTADGAGSGLDADLLDGKEGALYMEKLGSTLESYSEKRMLNAVATGTVDLDLAVQNTFVLTPSGPVTLNPINVPTTGKAVSITLIINQPTTPQAITFPASFKWSNDVAPDISTADKTSVITAVTVDGGARFYAFLAGNKFTT